MPARASTSPFEGSSAAMPPKRPARPTTAASWMRVSIVVRTGAPGRGRARASRDGRPATHRRGGPRSRSSNASSRPLWPTGQSRGKPCAYKRLPLLAAVSSGSMLPAIESAMPVSGEERSPAGPRASTRRFRDRSVARSGRTLLAGEALSVAQLREYQARAPVDPLAGRDEQLALQGSEDLRLDAAGPPPAIALAVGAVGFDSRLGGRVGCLR